MDLVKFTLKFHNAPLHIGTNRPGFEHSDEIIHSDTLFSAIINAWRLLYPEDLKVFFAPTHETSLDFPHFQVSSAFPCFRGQYFYPRLRWPFGKEREETEPPSVTKEKKKVLYLEESIFLDVIGGKGRDFRPEETFGDGRYWSPGPKTDKERKRKPISSTDVPRIVKDRKTQTTDIFHFSRVLFHRDAGLFFLVKFDNERWQERFHAVLNLLADEGVGGDRSVGHGQFNVHSVEQLSWEVAHDSNHFVSLSLYHPRADELNEILYDSAYDLITRRGWVHSERGRQLRRQSVRMFVEGSVFSGDWRKPRGDLVVVLKKSASRLDHHVYRYGVAFVVPFKAGGKGNG